MPEAALTYGTDELPIDMPVTMPENRAVATPALRAIIAERVAQLRKGHSPEADRDMLPTYLPKRAKEYLGDAIDQLTPGAVCHDVKRGKRKLAQAAALLMAAYDAIPDAGPDAPEPVDGAVVCIVADDIDYDDQTEEDQ